METYIKNHKFPFGKSLTLTSNEAVKQAVIAGLGVSMMPLIGLKNSLASKAIQIVPTDDCPITTEWNLVWLKNKKLSPVASSFLEYIRERKQMITKQRFSWTEKYINKYSYE